MNLSALSTMYFTVLSIFYLKTKSEIYTSIADIEYLVDSRKKLMEELFLYIDKEEKRLSTIKRYLDINKREHIKAMTNIPNYVGSPISVFILVKSLTVDLIHVQSKITIGREAIDNVTIKHWNFTYPNSEDLSGAAQGLVRLKKMYNLDVKDIVGGKLNGSTVSGPMSTCDCYELGNVLYQFEDYEAGRAFFEEAYRKYNLQQMYYFNIIDIIERVGYGSYVLGELKYGKKWIEKILQIDPNNEKAIFSYTFFQNEIQKEENGILPNTPEYEIKPNNHKRIKQTHADVTRNFKNYEELCRGQLDVPLQISKRLTCTYLNDRHPFFKIAPIKIEMKYLSPDLVLFHDVLSDKEIETLIRLAKPRLSRAKVIDEKTGKSYVQEEVRISKVATIHDKESDILFHLSQRVSHLTGLSMEHSKLMQVVNYGVGGSYDPHHDYCKVIPDTYTKLAGRRIATIMLYLSDVPQGGATVFPKLGVSVTPVKGTALFWYNLHPSGESNRAMLHGACPVLQGSKWILVRFLYQKGQELRKPCSLKYQKEGVVGVIPQPVLKETRIEYNFKRSNKKG